MCWPFSRFARQALKRSTSGCRPAGSTCGVDLDSAVFITAHRISPPPPGYARLPKLHGYAGYPKALRMLPESQRQRIIHAACMAHYVAA